MPGYARVCHTWELTGLRQLATLRRHAHQLLTETGAPGDDGAEAVERAVLVIDELASNALRHGAPPAALQLCDQGRAWLVVVTDSAPQRLPSPAVDRPAGQGGYGLYVITDLAISRGTAVDPDVKRVWALLPKT